MGVWSRLKRTFFAARHGDEIRAELDFHLEQDVAEGRERREARLRLGNQTRIAEETRAIGVVEWLDSALSDARYGLRQLRKTPALVTAVVLSLAIGVGANTAIFSLIDAALLRPLPVPDPGSLRIIEWTNDEFPKGVNNINGDFGPFGEGRVKGSSVSAPLHRRLAREQAAFEALIGVADSGSVAIAVDSAPAEQVSLQHVSANFFQGLGALPVVGRPFREEDDRVGEEPVLIVSHRFWLRRLGGDESALDRTVRINNVPARIVGVAPQGFFGLRAGQWPDVYAPLAARIAFAPSWYDGRPRGENDGDWWVRQVGRLKPGVPEAAARTEIAALFRGMGVPEGEDLEPGQIPELITMPGQRGFNALNARDSSALWILMMLVGVLLLIVCANVANLLLSRSVGRQRESAVRLALGAARGRLFRQHLIESGVLALFGGAVGVALGYALAHSIHLVFQSGRDASNVFDLHLDPRMLAFAAGLSTLTAFLFGLAPAARAAGADLNDALKAQTRSITGGRLRLPRALVSAQIALCLTALVAAGLLGRSLGNLRTTDLGFERENLVYASVNPWQAGYSAERVNAYVDRVREELSGLPGVVRVTVAEVRLLSGNGNTSRVRIPGREEPIERGVVDPGAAAQVNRVGNGFFETLRVPLVTGRTLEQRDFHPNPDSAVVDERFARHFFLGQNPLGLRFGLTEENPSQYEIVGVTRNALYRSLRDEPLPTLHLPLLSGDLRIPVHFAIRATVDAGSLAEAVRNTVASVDPAVPLTEFHTQTGLIDRLLRTERLLGFLSGAFGIVALTLAAIGLGGLLSYAVACRTNEIGVRMALGAAVSDVVRMVVRDSLRMAGAGLLIGLPGAYAVSRLLESTLFKLEPLDPATAALSLGLLTGVALLAAWLPARRAARIHPVTALREE
jgi:predicted permease